MPDVDGSVATDAQSPEATATPADAPRLTDEQTEALKTLGIEDPADAVAYFTDKGNWDKQINRRLMEMAGQKDDRLIDTVREVADRLAPPKPKEPERFIPEDVFVREFGINSPEDRQREATLEDLYRVSNHVGTQVRQELRQVLEGVPTDENGKPKITLGELLSRVDSVSEGLNTVTSVITGEKVDQVRTAVGTKFHRADPSIVNRAIEEAGEKGLRGSEFRDYVLSRAEKSHDHVMQVARDAVEEERRKFIPAPNYTGAGEGSTPSGEKPLNPWKDTDRAKVDTRV